MLHPEFLHEPKLTHVYLCYLHLYVAIVFYICDSPELGTFGWI